MIGPRKHQKLSVSYVQIGHFRVPKTLKANCKAFLVKMSFIPMRLKNHFHVNGYALSLALKQRLGETRKRPVGYLSRQVRLFLRKNPFSHVGFVI